MSQGSQQYELDSLLPSFPRTSVFPEQPVQVSLPVLVMVYGVSHVSVWLPRKPEKSSRLWDIVAAYVGLIND